MGVVGNAPVPEGYLEQRSRRSSSSLRYLWMVLTGVIGGASTFFIYHRMYHAMQASQMMFVSIDTMNVVQDMSHLPVEQVLQNFKQIKEQQQLEQDKRAERHVHDKRNQKKWKRLEDKLHQDNLLQAASDNNDNKDKNNPLSTTGPKQTQANEVVEIQPQDVVRSLDGLAGEERTKVYFLNQTQVTHKDSFSASWLQSKHDFLDMHMDAIKICEDAAFKAWNTRKDKLRMTMDYFDFSVEHLSKWWKLLKYHESPIVYNSVVSKLHAYIRAGGPVPEPRILDQTVATIAFQPYKMGGQNARNPLFVGRAYNLTIVSLAATVESLRRAEFGRVVVVGSADEHEKYTQDAIEYLRANLVKVEQVGNSTTKEQLVGHLEVAYAQVTEEQTKTKRLARNMPKGALVGVREAFVLADKENRTQEEAKTINTWFGTGHDPQHWQYLYLTEPDSILTTRATSLPQIKEEIDLRGGIISPFRLQPVPHESDLRGYNQKDKILRESEFGTVLELDHTADSRAVCCDEHGGHDHRPGKSLFPACGIKKWFLCGFEEKVPTEDPHKRLKPYQLFRLTQGTGLTTIGGNLFARRCFAGENAVCKPPHVP